MKTQTFTDTLVVVTCGATGCGQTFGMTEAFYRQVRDSHETWYCPSGHPRVYLGESAIEKERRLRQAAERQAGYARASRDAARDQAEAAERSARAYKGHATRLRNRIANGVCPVPSCRRSFENVRRHIAGQHPDWAHEHPDAMTP
jgi:hypothetical protein